MLTSLNQGICVDYISKFISFNPYTQLPPRYKNFYGIRFCGIHNDRPMFYGFDLFYQITGCGLDLERFLEFCFTNNLHVDWYNFQRTSIERGGWSYKTLTTKLSYPITEIYGKQYWEQLLLRFQKYEMLLLTTKDK